MGVLQDSRIAVLATDGVEESELIEPFRALREEGAQVDVLVPRGDTLQAFRHFDRGRRFRVHGNIGDADPGAYDAVFLPGGALNADQLRMVEEARQFVRAINHAGKPIAAICHAPWLLVSAGLAAGRTLTSYFTLQDDIRNAGGFWMDWEAVVDGNLVTSRQPRDLPAFNAEMIRLFSDFLRAGRVA